MYSKNIYYFTIMETSSHAYRLCRNNDCKRYPDDEDFDKDDETNYVPRGEWQKCKICDGYFTMKDKNYILFIEEEPNCYHLKNRSARCHLCGNGYGVSQNKITGEYICMDSCFSHLRR